MGQPFEIQHLAKSAPHLKERKSVDRLEDSFTLDSTDVATEHDDDLSSATSLSLQNTEIVATDRMVPVPRRPSMLAVAARQSKVSNPRQLRNEPLSNASWHGEKSTHCHGTSCSARPSLSKNHPRFLFKSTRSCSVYSESSHLVKPYGTSKANESSKSLVGDFSESASSISESIHSNTDKQDRPIVVNRRADMMLRKQASARYLKMSQARANSCSIDNLLDEYESIVD